MKVDLLKPGTMVLLGVLISLSVFAGWLIFEFTRETAVFPLKELQTLWGAIIAGIGGSAVLAGVWYRSTSSKRYE